MILITLLELWSHWYRLLNPQGSLDGQKFTGTMSLLRWCGWQRLLAIILCFKLQSFYLIEEKRFGWNCNYNFLEACLIFFMVQEFDSERKWKFSMAKKIAQRANKSIVDQATKGERKQKVWLIWVIYLIYEILAIYISQFGDFFLTGGGA